MKIMISQPMNGRSYEEILEARNKALDWVRRNDYELEDTIFEEYKSPDKYKEQGYENIPLLFLSKSLEKMSKCEAVYFLKGWDETRGCRIEHTAAIAYGLKVFYEQ